MNAVTLERPAEADVPLADGGGRAAAWLGWASLPTVLLLWIAAASQVPDYVLPQPWQVVDEGVHWLRDGRLPAQLARSLLRDALGFGIATAMAFALGAALGLSRPVRAFMGPITSLAMAIPPIAWTPVMMLFLGLGDASIVAVVVLSAMFPMALTVQEGVQSVDAGHLRAARALGARRLQRLRHVYLPACLPSATAALRIGFGQGWRALVAAEMIGASTGIGWMVATGGQVGNSAQVLLGISLIALIAWAAERLVFRRLEARYAAWQGQ